MKTKHHILTAAACFAAALGACIALASCTGDANEPLNAGQRTPLVFTAGVHASPAATRANTVNNQWTVGDWVAVEMDGVVKRYLATATGATTTLAPADAENTHYLPQGNCTVRAWRYGHTEPFTEPFTENFDWNYKPARWWILPYQVDATDAESGYQMSDFLYAPEVTVSSSAASGGNIGLTFYHQTARVVVNVREGGAVTATNKEKIDVGIGGSLTATTSNMSVFGTFAAGLIDPANGKYSGLTADFTVESSSVTPKPIVPAAQGYALSFEALVIPQDMSGQKFIEVVIPELDPGNPSPSPEGGFYIYTPAAGEADLQGGYTYTYDITVSEHGSLHVTPGTPIEGWGPEEEAGSGMAYEKVIDLTKRTVIDDNGTYLLTGTNLKAPDLLVVIQGGKPTIILKDVDIQCMAPITIEGATPTIKVEGKNRIISNDGPVISLTGEKTNVRIIGDGRDKSELTAKVLDSSTGLFSSAVIGSDYGVCGDISLQDITLVADNNVRYSRLYFYGAVIGDGGKLENGRRKCGMITIKNCHVEATVGPGAAAIGFGYYATANENSVHEMGAISIVNSTIKSTVQKGANGSWPAHIGGSADGEGQYMVGKITITPPEGTTAKEFFKDFTKIDGSAMSDNDVIVGFPEGAKPTSGTEFDVFWNNQPLQVPVIRWGDRDGLQ